MERSYARLKIAEKLKNGKDNVEDVLVDAEEDPIIELSLDAYDAVVAAAFGGIRIIFPSDEKGRTQAIRIHPAVIFFFCLVLFTVQLSCLSCLILDMHMGNVWDGTSWEGFDESPKRQMHMMMRTMMVFVLQMIGLKELIGAMRPMCFILNPISWFELERPPLEGWGCLFHAGICAPICFTAQLMQFGIAYYTLVVSMSVIIVADDIKDMVFNGLVVMFLADLDEYAWTAISAVCHMDHKFFDDFQVRVKDHQDEAHVSERNKDMAREVEEFREKARPGWKLWFYHGKGGKASVLQSLTVFFLLTLIYIRQLFIFVQAVHTGIMPSARDVCSLYRGLMDPQNEWSSALQLRLVDLFTWINYRAMLSDAVIEENVSDACFTDAYKAGPFDDAMQFIRWWPQQIITMLVAILFIFAVPQLVHANFKKIYTLLQSPERT